MSTANRNALLLDSTIVRCNILMNVAVHLKVPSMTDSVKMSTDATWLALAIPSKYVAMSIGTVFIWLKRQQFRIYHYLHLVASLMMSRIAQLMIYTSRHHQRV